MTLDETAHRLYTLAPADFTAARNAEVKAARDRDERALADRIKALRRPTLSAWLVNRLTREHAEDMASLLALGEELRAAMGSDPTIVRALIERRRELVGALVRRTADLTNRAPNAAAQEELTATLEAATADAAVAERVRGGRLVSAERYAGLGLSGPLPPAPPRDPPRLKRPATEPRAAIGAAKAAYEAARRRAEETSRTLVDARAEAARLERAWAASKRRLARAETAAAAAKAASAGAREELRIVRSRLGT